jgi:hypothetical protein
MPELTVTAAQRDRLEEISEDLEDAYVDGYGTVRPVDALEYLLDTYTPPEADADSGSAGDGSVGGADAGADAADDTGPDSGGDGGATDADGAAETLQQAMSLLDAHDDRWRESSGDEPYEVDLPDGSTEAVRTKDDIKRLLFKHWN